MPKTIHTELHRKFCALLADRRKEAGLTQETLAKRLGKPQSFVAKYENGERRLDVIEFIEVARVAGFDSAEFIRELCRH